MTKEELANRAVFPMGKENTAFAQYFQGQSYLNMLTTEGICNPPLPYLYTLFRITDTKIRF